GVDHHAYQRGVARPRRPLELTARLARVGLQGIHLRRPHETRIHRDVLLPVEANVREGQLAQLADRVHFAGPDHVIGRAGRLQHAPHGVHVIAREAPVAPRGEIAEPQVPRLAFHGSGDAYG